MKASVLICSKDGHRDGNVPLLIKDIEDQTYSDIELIIIKGVSPIGKARNQGIKKANGEIIIFFDDDIRIPDINTVSKLVAGIERYNDVLAGGARLIPPDSNFVQRWIAREMPREEIKMVNEDTFCDSVATYCWATPKSIYDICGFFREDIEAGEDTEMRRQITGKGFRIVLLKNTFIIHPARETMLKFLQQRYWYGTGIGNLKKANKNIRKIPKWVLYFYLALRLIYLPLHIFTPNINNFIKGREQLKLSFKPLYALADIIYSTGFVRGYK